MIKKLSAEINISSLSKKGHGLGLIVDTERQVEVPFTVPGDKVRAHLLRKRGGVSSSLLEEIITPSPLRIVPRCIHFASCGGCRWQQLDYEEQLKIKQKQIESLFREIVPADIPIRPIIPCDPPWNYRNKMEFSFSSDAAGKKYLGLIIDSSRGKVLNLTECHLTNPWFVEAITATRQWWHESALASYHPHSNTGALRTLTVREGIRSGDRLVMLTVSGNPEYALNRQQLDSFTAFLRDAIEPVNPNSRLSIFLRIQQTAKGVETNFFEMLLYGEDHIRETLYIETDPSKEAIPLEFDVSPSAFFQPNTRQAEKLYSIGLQLLDIPPHSVVYDLYCGTGTLGICAAKNAALVVGVEISPESSLDARTNAAKNGLENVQIFTGSVRDVIDEIRKNAQLPLPDIVMLDPPRVGLDKETIQHLAALKPKKLLYISCNPTTQAENLIALKEIGYHITAVQPVDQFPHTVHIENIVVLQLATA
ncbi:MAG: 23S rRNA (uracil(1939)-C(5))-methyltransferase RlmD [Parachlamydiaceae bacterium]